MTTWNEELETGKGVAPTAAPRGRWRNPDRGTRAAAQTRGDPPTRRSPEEVVSAAQERVQKLERVLEVLGEDSGPEFHVLQNSLKKAKAAAQRVPLWGRAGTVSEIRGTIGEAVASPRRRAREGGQVVGGSETTCGTFAFRVGSQETTPPPTNGSSRLRTGIGSVESLCGGVATRARRSSCTVVDARREAQSWEEQVIAQSITRSLRGRVAAFSGGKSPFVECDGDVDRQCGVVCQVEPPIQPHVNLWCRELSARYGMRAQRVGEASHPGPATHRVRRVPDSPGPEHVELRRGTRRRRRLRPLPWSWDSDSESDADRNGFPRTDGEVPATVPASQTALHEVGRRASPEQVPLHDSDAFEEDMDHGGARFGRRVVLHPQSSGGTPRSVQDRSPNMSMRDRFAALGTETASGHSAARVPPDVFDALEEDLGPSNDGVALAGSGVGRLEVAGASQRRTSEGGWC